MKFQHSQRNRFNHYLNYLKTPFGRNEEFKDIKESRVTVKQQITTHYTHFAGFSRKSKVVTSYIVTIQHKFKNGDLGGYVKHGVTDSALKNTVEYCFAKPPRVGWSLVI